MSARTSKTIMAKNSRKILLGTVGVDSGQLLIVDPCYLSAWRDGAAFPDGRSSDADNHYSRACKATSGKELGGEILVSGIAGNGVAFSSGFGDGSYEVWGTITDYGADGGERISKVEIILI